MGLLFMFFIQLLDGIVSEFMKDIFLDIIKGLSLVLVMKRSALFRIT